MVGEADNDPEPSSQEQAVRSAILAHLKQCPRAMDTFDGIAEWWLMRQHMLVQLEVLTNVLARLTQDQTLEMIGPPENPCYRLRVPSPPDAQGQV